MTRLTMGHGSPRDLAALEAGLRIAEAVVGLIRQTKTNALDAALPATMESLLEMLVAPLALADKLAPALADELP
ncbi:MAG: hypothetical protein ACPGOZ_04520, partial [Candidatus Puniceispirillum sp.]